MRVHAMAPDLLARVKGAVRGAISVHLFDPNVRMIDFGIRRRDGAMIEDELAVRIHVIKKLRGQRFEEAVRRGQTRPVPQSIGGLPTDVIEACYRIHAGDSRTARVTSLCGGISVSNLNGRGAGTLGAEVIDRGDGRSLILSNWHVFAENPLMLPGSPIVQPGRLDGGGSGDVVAKLDRDAMEKNLDAAVAAWCGDRPLGAGQLDAATPAGVCGSQIGMQVQKSGRTTGVTEGRIVAINGVIRMDYPGFERVIGPTMTIEAIDDGDALCDGGDSGSLWVEVESGLAVGLHFAGTEEPLSAVAIELQAALDALDVDLAVRNADGVIPK